MLKSIADDKHHYSKFSTGNKITLPACAPDESSDGDDNKPETDAQTTEKHPLEDVLKDINNGKYDENDMGEFVRAALLAFHERQYRPKNMTAVMIGPQSLDELEAWVVPRFGQIPDRWLNKYGEGEGKDNKDDDDATLENPEKWQAMQRAAAQIVGDSAPDAPPVSIHAADMVEHRSAFRPELLGGQFPVVLTTKPLQAIRTLVLYFPLPPSYHNPDRSPTSILSHLFGHEGPGSAFAVLQDAGWISSLSSGNRISGPDQTLFQIQVSLTVEGEEHWKDVVRVIFHYGKVVCHAAEESFAASGVSTPCKDGDDKLRRIWAEVAALGRMHFHQTSPGAVYSFASSVAQSISKHGTEQCLSAGNLLNENRDSLPLKEMLDFAREMVPQNCFIERCSAGAWEEMEASYKENNGSENSDSKDAFIFGKQTEKWYGVDYYLSPVDKEDVQHWKTEAVGAALHLPEPNRYIPRSMGLCSDLPEEAKVQRIEKPIDPPELIVNKPDGELPGRLWWRLDDRYALPKASVTLLIRTATAENKLQPTGTDNSETDLLWEFSSGTSMQSSFITNIYADSLAQDTYDAYLAGLGWSLSKSSSGFTLSCSGYSDRLSDLAIKLLTDFCNTGDGNFLEESHFATTQDKTRRGLRSYFESRRADSLALYYHNLLLSSKGEGIESNLDLAEAITLADVVRQHDRIWTDESMSIEVLYTGNVSQREAEEFFGKATTIIESAKSRVAQKCVVPTNKGSPWVPGPLERRLPGEDLELHFASKNPKEENGAVIVTYQSQEPGFKGKSLSSEESLRQSAAIRLLCKMIKEPVFNELRTKQQLGYIVSSYYDVNYSTRQPNGLGNPAPLATSIDSLVVYVLSRKEAPTEVANRIDDFLINFRSRLEEMSTDEVQNYADSMAKALTKPIRKLGTEASSHMAKIRMYAPETLIEGSGYSVHDLPWDNPHVLAGAIRKIDRDAILKAYDLLVVKKESRSRIVSFVYGKTFPLEVPAKKPNPGRFSASSLDELMAKRKQLIAYDPSSNYPKEQVSSIRKMFGKHRTTMRYAVAAAAVVGVGVWGTMAIKGRGADKKQK